MATSIININVPAGTGFGIASVIGTLVGEKTVQLSGTFTGSYVLYVSQNGTTYVPLLIFDSGGPEGIKKTFAGAFSYAKLLSKATNSSGVTANISGLEEIGANSWVGTTVAAGFSGVSPIENLGVTFYQEDVCGTLSGQFVGEFIVEGSLDGSHFNPIGLIKSQAPSSGLLGPSNMEFAPFTITDKLQYLRATLNGIATTALTLTIGGRQDTTLNPAEKATIDSVILVGPAGEDFAGVVAIGEKDAAGTVKLFKATADGAAPVQCVGITSLSSTTIDESVTLQTVGVSGYLSNAAWVTAPVATDVGKTVYLAKAAGKSFTLDVSGYGQTDLIQALGVVEKAAPGSKIRLEIKPADGVPNSVLSALFRGSIISKGPVNVALGCVYTADGGYNQYVDSSGVSLTDGVPAGTYFQTYIPADIGWYDANPYSKNVIINLREPCLISQTLVNYGTNNTNVLFPVVTVSVSPDGTNWQQVFSGSYAYLNAAASGRWLQQDFPPCLAKYVKITSANEGTMWTFAGEFKVMGVPMGSQETANLVFTGDSLTAVGSSVYPADVVAALTTGCVVHNIAVGGKTCQQLIVDDVTRADPLVVPGTFNAIFAFWGTNDLFVGTTASQLAGYAQTYCEDRKAAGFNAVLVGTILPRSSAGTPLDFEAQRTAYNTWLRANYRTFADGLMDFAADSRIGPAGAETNAYLYTDLVHMTAAGSGIQAGIALRTYHGVG